jgi:sugar phosphate isomerase/epimerase
MKIGVSAYSFHVHLTSGRLTLEEAVKAAAKLGFEGFEMLPRYFKSARGVAAEAAQLRKMLADSALETSCYTLSSELGLAEGPERRAAIENVRREIDIAVVLGARVCRVEGTAGPGKGEEVSFDEMLKRVVEGTKPLADYALKMGVKLGVENHGHYMGSFHRIAQLIKDVNSPAYGAVPDIGNFLLVDEDPASACRELARHAVHVHAKDFVRKPPVPSMGKGWFISTGGFQHQGAVVGEGDVPVRECLKALRDRGYDGFLSVEHEAPEDPLEGLKRSRANLAEMLAALG